MHQNKNLQNMRQNKISLRKLIETEIQSALTEEISEPSEQILKAVTAAFKSKTGINTGLPIFTSKSKRYNEIYYEVDLDKEIKTPIMQSIFRTLKLSITVTALSDSIGGYVFNYQYQYTHPSGGSNGLNLGTIYYKDNIFSFRGF